MLLGVLLGLGIPAAIVYYFMLGGKEKLALGLFNQKSLAAKVKSLFKKDMSSKCARSTFYMNNDYDNGYSQKEWMDLYNERVSSKEWDEKSEEYAEAVAPFINAIVVGDTGYYLRRGMENLDRAFERFLPGVNDQISLNYFVEPYEYSEDEELKAESIAAERARKKAYEADAPKRAARERCYNCIHNRSCSWDVKQQTGSCGGYTPKR